MKIEIYQVDAGWYWRVKARNGRILCSSEGYHRKQTMLRTIKSIGLKAPIIEI
jgi:uncharacterized protein YegP (UPF0339 family)